MPLRSRDRAGWLDRFRDLSGPRRWAVIASAVWIVVVCSYAIGFFARSAGALDRGTVFVDGLFFLVALVLPLLLVWLAAWLAEELARQREVIAALAEVTPPLMAELAATRAALQAGTGPSRADLQEAVRAGIAGVSRGPDVESHLLRIAAALTRSDKALREIAERVTAPPAPAAPAPEAAPPPRPAPAPEPRPEPQPEPPARATPPEPPAQPSLPLLTGNEPDTKPGWDVLIRALDFPRDAKDHDGFRALKIAIRHPSLAQMLQAAEDVLSLLAQEGIYADELAVEPGTAGDWRRFMAGARGPEVAAVGGIRDPEVLATARRMMKSDPIFRDTALFFHRRFDAVLGEFATDAEDDQILAIADTRSGRAFMLLARLSGAFD